MKVVDSAFAKMAGQEMEQVASVSILVEKFNSNQSVCSDLTYK